LELEIDGSSIVHYKNFLIEQQKMKIIKNNTASVNEFQKIAGDLHKDGNWKFRKQNDKIRKLLDWWDVNQVQIRWLYQTRCDIVHNNDILTQNSVSQFLSNIQRNIYVNTPLGKNLILVLVNDIRDEIKSLCSDYFNECKRVYNILT